MTFPHTATIQRQTEASGKYTYGNSGTTQCFLQPLDNEESVTFGITFSQSFQCYIPHATDVTDHDRLIIDGDKYGVRGIRFHGYGDLKHKRLILERL